MKSDKCECLVFSQRLDFSSFLPKKLHGAFPTEGGSMRSMSLNEDGCPWSTVYSARNHRVSKPEDEGTSKVTPLRLSLLAGDCPATRALNAKCDLDASQKDGTFVKDPSHKKMIKRSSLRRTRPSSGSIDLSDLLQATQPVVDSISFPAIGWSFLDDGDSEDERAVRLPCSLKRNRSSSGFNDLSDLLQATQPVPDSISFPAIGRSFLDDGDSEDERDVRLPSFCDTGNRTDTSSIEAPNAKRHCKGLVRSRKLQSGLFLLGEDQTS